MKLYKIRPFNDKIEEIDPSKDFDLNDYTVFKMVVQEFSRVNAADPEFMIFDRSISILRVFIKVPKTTPNKVLEWFGKKLSLEETFKSFEECNAKKIKLYLI